MCVLRKMRAVAGILLLSPGLGMADDSGAVMAGPQAAPVQQVAESQQAIPLMMPMGGAPAYSWVPPPGMMWPMPPQYLAPMTMPSAPPVTWMPFVWVLVPVPADMPGAADMSNDPVANTPVAKLPPLNAAPAPTPTEIAAPVMRLDEAKVNASPIKDATGAALPLAATLSAAGLSEPVSVPVVTPADEKSVVHGSVTPTPVVTPPLLDSVPVTLPAEAVMPDGAAEAVKASPAQATGVAGEAVPPTGLGASPEVESATVLSASAPTMSPVNKVVVDYGPVAATPVVDLLTLMQSSSPPARAPARRKAVRKPSASIPFKPRPTATSKPVKQRMCWTRGVVAPCR